MRAAPQPIRSLLAQVRRAFPRKPPQNKILLNSLRTELRENPFVRQCYEQMSLPRRDIETEVQDKATARRLMDRVIGQWRELSTEPYWCNDTLEGNKLANIDAPAIDDFYADGAAWMETLSAFESRSGISIPNGTCVELGAGVGKYTHALAKRFARVVAVDVAPLLLDLSAERLERAGVTNVTTMQLTYPDDLANVGPIDFFLAQAVLAHNPPPIQRLLLTKAFEALRPGGGVLFQTPDWLDGYTFSSKRFVEKPPDAMCDCHCFPKTEIFRLLREQGLELLDIAPDFNTEAFGSYTYFARKRDAGQCAF